MKKIILPLILILSTIQLIGQTVLDNKPIYNDSLCSDSNYTTLPITEWATDKDSFAVYEFTEEDLFRDGTSNLNLIDEMVPYYFVGINPFTNERFSLKDSLKISFKEWGRWEHLMAMDNYITFDVVGYDNFPKNITKMGFTWFVDDKLVGKEYLFLASGERYNVLEKKLTDNPQYDQITYKVANLRNFKKFKKSSVKPSINLTVVITIKDKENNIYDCSKTLRLYYDNDKGWYVLKYDRIIPIWKI